MLKAGSNIGSFGKRKHVVATELRNGKNGERLVGSNGEFNAGSKEELTQQIGRLLAMASAGNEIVTETEAEAREATQQRLKAVATIMREDGGSHTHRTVGSAMGEELYITQTRQGIMRNVLQRQEVVNGQVPKVTLRQRNIMVSQATGPTQTEMQMVRDNWLYPSEFYFSARPYIEQLEISRNSNDVLEEKYFESMQGFMVAEDRLFREMCLRTIGQANPQTTQIGSMNPTALGKFRDRILSWGLTPAQWLIASDMWTDLIGDSGFSAMFDPVAKHEIVLTGKLGTILGMDIKSDAYRHPEWRVLDKGEQFIFSTPDTLGTYTDRGGITVDPIDASQTSVPGKGWNMYSMQSITLANFRGVACGKRIQ